MSVSPPNVNFSDPVTLTATVTAGTGTGIPTGTVQFLAGSMTIGTAPVTSSGTAILTLTILPAGSNSITASYPGDSTFMGSSTLSPSAAGVSWPPKMSGPPATHTIAVGGGPVAMALNPLTHRLYTANRNSNDVTVLDARTSTVLVPSIPAGRGPSAIAVNTQTNMIYVANYSSSDVTVIDGNSNLVVSTISVSEPRFGSIYPRNPISIAINSSTNQIYVGNGDCGSFIVIDGATQVVSFPDPLGYCGPNPVMVSSLSGQAYRASYGDFVFSAYESGTNALIGDLGGGNAPVMALNPPDILVGNGTGITIYNEYSNLMSGNIQGGGITYSMAVNPLDQKFYLANVSPLLNQPATVTVIDGINHLKVKDIPVGQATASRNYNLPIMPDKIAIDSNANLVFVANELSNDVTIIDGNFLSPITTVSVGRSPSALLVNPENCALYVANASDAFLTVVDTVPNGPGVCLSSASLIFPGQEVGTTSLPQTVTLTNIGNGNLNISGLVPAGDFLESDSCAGKVIPPGQQCSIQVRFSPSTQGPLKGMITITDNSNATSHSIALTGNGVLPTTTTLSVDANPALFGQSILVTATVTSSQGFPTSGSVVFYDSQTQIGMGKLDTTGTASISYAIAPVGSHPLTAVYHGNIRFLGSRSIPLIETVNKGNTSINLYCWSCASFSGGNATQGSPVTLQASVSVVPPGAPAGTEPSGAVIFYDGTRSLGMVPFSRNQSPALTISTLINGIHSITAQYAGDSNLNGSVSAPLSMNIVSPPPGTTTGGGTTGGGTTGTGTACACSKTGDYVLPAPVAQPILGSFTPISGTSGQYVSPNQVYTVTDSVITDPVTNVQSRQLVITKNGSKIWDSALRPITLSWSFSPDNDRLYYGYLDNSGSSGPIDNTFVLDLSGQTVKQIVSTQSSGVHSITRGFSPSGGYFLYAYSTGQNNQTRLEIYKVQGVSQQTLQYQTNFTYFIGGVTDNFGVAGWGFSPDSPESSFVFAYTISQQQVQWRLVNLSNPQSEIKNDVLGKPADFWEYSPCGDMIGVVKQTSQSSANIDLISTSKGGPPLKSYSAPSLNITLKTTTTTQQVLYDTQVVNLIPNSCGGGGSYTPPVNTSTGSNNAVSTTNDATSTTVTVTFADITTPGDTTVDFTSDAPAVPSGFQLGSPPIYYSITTTAAYIPPISICIGYDPAKFDAVPTTLLHYNSNLGAWEDITTYQDVTNHLICGVSQSLSPFVIGSFSTVVTPADTIPPTITATLSSPPNAAGWYNSDVTVSFACSDSGSGIATCPASVTVSSEGARQVISGTATDKAGNSASASVTINLDKTPPALTFGAASPPPNAAGWNSTDVSVPFTVADNLSGIAGTSLPSPLVLSTEGSAVTRTVTVTDIAGNSATFTSSAFKIDKTPPEAFLQFDPVHGEIAVFGKDSLSGVDAGPVIPAVAILPEQPVRESDDRSFSDDEARELRIYTINDLADNSAILTIQVKRNDHELTAKALSLKYNSQPAIVLPQNAENFEWEIETTGTLKKLEQQFAFHTGQYQKELEAKFNLETNQTVIKQEDLKPETRIVKQGLVLLRLMTDVGKLLIQY